MTAPFPTAWSHKSAAHWSHGHPCWLHGGAPGYRSLLPGRPLSCSLPGREVGKTCGVDKKNTAASHEHWFCPFALGILAASGLHFAQLLNGRLSPPPRGREVSGRSRASGPRPPDSPEAPSRSRWGAGPRPQGAGTGAGTSLEVRTCVRPGGAAKECGPRRAVPSAGLTSAPAGRAPQATPSGLGKWLNNRASRRDSAGSVCVYTLGFMCTLGCVCMCILKGECWENRALCVCAHWIVCVHQAVCVPVWFLKGECWEKDQRPVLGFSGGQAPAVLSHGIPTAGMQRVIHRKPGLCMAKGRPCTNALPMYEGFPGGSEQ